MRANAKIGRVPTFYDKKWQRNSTIHEIYLITEAIMLNAYPELSLY